ncbi:ATP-binding protein [Candidatus Poribacteria bacterium]|nr:ATP-binding protein [Candidatus Poribacteria bacterium]MYG07887.1 ATP-binding protein [Candidatus Poribacteria bacterium]MYK21262.1 ATP-binding protein [Candidatus Poribacteria bacterium]
MRITDIEIKNFRAFPKTYKINLSKSGKNLLVYGENGSGKSSLYLALKYFLESGVDENNGDNKSPAFENYQNIFIQDPGHIKLSLRADRWSKKDTYEWSQRVTGETNDELITEASKSNGFLDYKSLLETHYLHRESESVNLFNLLVKTLLANTVNPLRDRTLAEDWNDIQPPFPRRSARNQIENLEGRVVNFNRELANRLTDLRPKVSEILNKFGYDVLLDLNFQGITYNRDKKTLDNQEILLKVEFFDAELPSHHIFLNEAKLSAIAIAIYLSSILIQPDSTLKILALDDVLIGLDMSNRLPVLDILDEYFSDHQIFLTTYDKVWYEIVKQRTSRGGKWKAVEFYFSQTDAYEVPIYVEDKAYLEKAREHLDTNDYKACAIYVRTAFEAAIKQYCEKKDLAIKYRENPRDLKSEDFWGPIKMETDEAGLPLLDLRIIDAIERVRKFILNELSHATFANIYRKELEDAIEAVEALETALV